MKPWKNILSRFNRGETLEDPLELENDARFVSWLEKDAAFEPHPRFTMALKNRLESQLFTQPALPEKRGVSFWFLKAAPAALGIGAVFIFIQALVSGLPIPAVEPVSSAVALSTATASPDLAEDKLNFIYDQNRSAYLSVDEAAKTLGFIPRTPDYLPKGYQLSYASLTYGSNRQANPGNSSRTTKAAPADEPKGLQFQLNSPNQAEKEPVQVYQIKSPFPDGPGFHFNVQGAQAFNSETIQGALGYLVSGARWRMDFIAARSQATPNSGTGTPPYSPSSSGQNLRSRPQGPFANGERGRFPNPPPALREAAMVAFGKFINSPLSSYIDFEPRADGRPARSLVWQKDGILLVLVGGDTFQAEELKRIGESFKPVIAG